MGSVSDTSLLILGVLEIAGLLGLFVLARRGARRRASGAPRAPGWLRAIRALYLLAVVVGVPAVLITAVAGRATRHERLREELMHSGQKAIATILDVQETGTVINHRPEVWISVTVRPEGEAPFDAEITWVLSVTEAQTYRVGTKVNVYFDPDDHDRVALAGLAVPRGAPAKPGR